MWCSVLLTVDALAASGGPFVYFDQDYIEIGMCMAKVGLVRFVPPDNIAVGVIFENTYPVTLRKMNRILPNSYLLLYGYREMDIIPHTQAESNGGIAISAFNFLPTSLQMKAASTKANMFRLFLVNYMCVH